MTSFEEIWNYFKLRNCWLNSKLCAKRKLSHSDVNTISNFNVSFLTKKTHVFTSECDNLRLAQSLEFNQQFLSLK